MGTRERSLGTRISAGLLFGVGLLGGLVAFDALLLFVVLLLGAVFIAPLNPYIGLLMFVAVPVMVMLGSTVAWTAYILLRDRAASLQGDEQHAHV